MRKNSRYKCWGKKANYLLYVLLLLSHYSCVRLCNPIDGSPPGSPIPGILQARTLEWVAISFSNAWKWKWRCSVMSDSSDPMDCSLPGSSVHGIFQARVLEWGAIAFSGPLEWLLPKTQEIASVGKAVEKTKPTYTVGGNVNQCNHLQKTIWRSFKKLRIELPYDPVIPLLDIYLKKQKH